MNAPSPALDSRAPAAAGILALRAQVDAIDAELAALVAERSGLAAAIAAAKGDQGFGWRPAREVEVLRAVLAGRADLNRELAATIWRALMATNLAAQGGLDVVATPAAEAAARLAFGGATPVTLADAVEALRRARDGARTIAVLPWPGPDAAAAWWPALLDPAFDGVHVCAATPLTARAPEALLLAKRAPEAAGGDVCLRIVTLDEARGADVVATAGGHALVARDGFSPDGPGRWLGAYALA
jgi:chorismate mutase